MDTSSKTTAVSIFWWIYKRNSISVACFQYWCSPLTGWLIFWVRFILQIMYCLEMTYSSNGTIIFMYVSPYDDAQVNKSWHLIKSIWANAISSEPWIFSSTNMTFRDFSFPSNHHWRIHLALAFILYMAKSKNFHDMFVFISLPISFNKWIPLDILDLCFWI